MYPTLRQLSHEEIVLAWPVIQEQFERIERKAEGLFLASQIRTAVGTGEVEIWVIEEGEGRVLVYLALSFSEMLDGNIILHIKGAAGSDIKKSIKLLPTIERYARERGAVMVQIMGRTGWKNLLVPKGYTGNFMAFNKHLGEYNG